MTIFWAVDPPLFIRISAFCRDLIFEIKHSHFQHQRRTQNPVKHLRWSLTIFAKKYHFRCLTEL